MMEEQPLFQQQEFQNLSLDHLEESFHCWLYLFFFTEEEDSSK
jgi:hypothetical protein